MERASSGVDGRNACWGKNDMFLLGIDGYIIKVDYTQQKKLAAAVSRVASNINQICRRINSTGHFYADDITELKERQGEIWQLLKSSQSEEL